MATGFFGLFSCGGAAVKNVEVREFSDALATGVRVIDVRTAEEYAEGCIPGAVNVDWNGEKFLSEIDALFDTDAPLYLYCRSGRRSAAAAKALSKEGYSVVNLLGGFNAWKEAGLPVDLDPKYAAELIPAGGTAPDFELADVEGKSVRLSDFRGKSVVLVFWASWCPDCRAEVPELKAMHASADPAEYEFVSVSFDKDIDTLRAFVAENTLPGLQLFDPAGKKESKVGAAFLVKWIPSLYLIGPDGKVTVSTVMAWKIAAALEGKPLPGSTASCPGPSGSGELCSDESCAL